MRKKAIAALVLTLVLVSGLAALAVGGSSGDPLISLGYITGTFLPDMTQQAGARAEDSAQADYQAAQDKLDAAQADYAARAGVYSDDWGYSDLFARKGYKLQDVIRLAPGSGFLFLEGFASAAVQGGELIDVSGGASYTAMGALQPGHRYLAGENAVVSVTILSDAAYLAPQGYSCDVLSTVSALPFTDLVSTQWYYSYVHYVCGQALFNGVSATQFSPGTPMTRAMLATVLHRLAGTPAGGAEETFSDVAADSWYAVPVNWAAGSGIVNGMGGGLYMPNQNVTREQMAVMLYRYAHYAGVSTDAGGDLTVFSDSSASSDWAREALGWTVKAGIIGGRTDGTLDPGGTATRAEVAAMLQRFSTLLK